MCCHLLYILCILHASRRQCSLRARPQILCAHFLRWQARGSAYVYLPSENLCLRQLVLGLFYSFGFTSLAAALRHGSSMYHKTMSVSLQCVFSQHLLFVSFAHHLMSPCSLFLPPLVVCAWPCFTHRTYFPIHSIISSLGKLSITTLAFSFCPFGSYSVPPILAFGPLILLSLWMWQWQVGSVV